MKVITVGKRMLPVDQVALIEAFDASSTSETTYTKEFKGRILMLKREYVLTEETPQAFAEKNGFVLFAEDAVGVNPAVDFKVEIFTPTEKFNPERPFATRLKWIDPTGNEQSKLLITAPETVIGELYAASAAASPPSGRPRRGHEGSRRMAAFVTK